MKPASSRSGMKARRIRSCRPKSKRNSLSGVDTTGHEWDGIQELNNPLPKWWLYVFYVCVAFSLGYWVLYPAIRLVKTYTGGILGYSQRDVVVADIAAARAAQGAYRAKIEKAARSNRSKPIPIC